jgi:tetratricopeptide (TPR) repeat protein
LLAEAPDKKFIGLYLGDPIYSPRRSGIIGDLLSIITEANDDDALRNYGDQTVIIDPKPISTIDFCLSLEEKKFLILQGSAAALLFLHKQGHISAEEAPAAAKQANDLKEAALKARKRRAKQKKIGIGAPALILAFCVLCVWWFFPKPWSLKNCESLANEATRLFDQNHSSTQGAQELIKCRNPVGYSILGDQAFFRRAYSEAELYFANAIRHLPEDEQTTRREGWYDDLASAEIEVGNYKDAIDILRRLVEQFPQEDEFKWDLAKAYIYQGQIDAAEFGLAVDTLGALQDQDYKGRVEFGRVQILKSAAYAGQSLNKDGSQYDRDQAKKRATEELCGGLSKNDAFWRQILRKQTSYPNASFKVEIDLLTRGIDGANVQCLSSDNR